MQSSVRGVGALFGKNYVLADPFLDTYRHRQRWLSVVAPSGRQDKDSPVHTRVSHFVFFSGCTLPFIGGLVEGCAGRFFMLNRLGVYYTSCLLGVSHGLCQTYMARV